ncbi:hypothetical protein [Cupriavidus sp. DF5525]|uniref:hypothetical protein n=1 Tax=Cupriavidus sp. DF5525 TaxID=3160989 RepID=UPI0032DE9B0B
MAPMTKYAVQPEAALRSIILQSPAYARVHLRGLRFPFPVVAEVIEGDCELNVPGQMRANQDSVLHSIRPLESPRLVLAERARVAFRQLPGQPVQSDARERPHKPIACIVALAVFQSPQKPWRLATASRELRIDHPGRLSRTLMSEGESFVDLVATQRLMRALFDLAEGDCQAARAGFYGFPDRARLEDAIFDRFGVDPSLLHRLLNIR